jgi:glycosyl transferase family 87
MSRSSLIAFCSRRWVKMAALVLLSVLFIVFLMQAYARAYRDVGYDLTSYLLSAQAILNGDNPFETDSPFTYSYPMFFAFALIPLSLLPGWLSSFIWYLINVASLLGSIILLVKLSSENLRTNWGAHLYAPVTIALLLLTGVVQNHLLNGQANFVVLLLCVLFLRYYFEDRALLASVFLALAVAIKLVPLVLFLFLLLRGSYKILMLSTVLVISFCLLPVVTLGGDLFDIYGDYIRGFIFGNFSGSELDHRTYFTLQGFLSQTVPALRSIPGLKIASAAAIALSVAVIDLIAMRRNGRLAGLWTCHLYFMAILFISPLSEIHHLAFLMPAFSLMLVKLLYDTNLPTKTYGSLLGAFVVCFYLGRAVAGPFFFLGILLLAITVARASLLRIASNSAPTDHALR